jgi:hypothetical protein
VQVDGGKFIDVDFTLGSVFDVLLMQDSVLRFVEGAPDGKRILIRIQQDGAGGHKLEFGPRWNFGNVSVMVSSRPMAVDYLDVIVRRTDVDVLDFKRGY